jgi:hypothetical protein
MMQNFDISMGSGVITLDDVSLALIETLQSDTVSIKPSGAVFKASFDKSPFKLSISQGILDKITQNLRGDSTSLPKFCSQAHVTFKIADLVPHAFLCGLLGIQQLVEMPWNCESEDEMHAFVQLAVSGPLCRFFPGSLHVTRNNKMDTSTGRPDYSLSVGGKQVFRGEDKLWQLAKSQDPEKELSEKSLCAAEWKRFYGDSVTYIFGYFCVGHVNTIDLHHVIITAERKVIRLTSQPFNIRSYSGMLACRLFTMSLFPHMMAVVNAVKSSVDLEWSIVKNNCQSVAWQKCSVTVGVVDDGKTCLVKQWDFVTRHGSNTHFHHMTALSNGFPESDYLMKFLSISQDVGLVKVKFSPFGFPDFVNKFDGLLAAKKCLLHVAVALSVLHNAGLVHNDMRWPNVVKAVHGGFILVDYDFTRKKDDDHLVDGVTGLDESSHAPNIARRHGVEVDIWGFGYMMETCVIKGNDAQRVVRDFGVSVKKTYTEAGMLESIIHFCSN